MTYLLANYNNGKYIGDCIASLHAQTNPHWHALIADDHSTDDSLARIQPLLGDKVHLLTNRQNMGYTRTLMRLLEHTTTDIVGILDPDDALYPNATETILQTYAQQPTVGFVYSNYSFYNADLTRNTGLGFSRPIPPTQTSLTDGFVGHLKTFRRSVYAQTAGWDPTMLYAEDRDLVYKMEEVTALAFVDQALYCYRNLPHSQSHDAQKQRIGAKNHYRAYRNALARRGISGRAKVGYLLLLYSRQVGHRLWLYSHPSQKDSGLRRLARQVRRTVLPQVERWAVELAGKAS